VALRRPLKGSGIAAGVDAMSGLLADLSREVAAAVRKMPPPA
jgi:LDH2 family malate/lactate/ureidoglycolate dehydrogenase